MRPGAEKNLAAHIAALGRPVFTARELAAVSGRSASAVSQGLAFLLRQGLVARAAHGVWAWGGGLPSPYAVAPYLMPKQRVYVSFTSALHLHGIIEQIPQSVTLASTSHSREMRTPAGVFIVHHLSPGMFAGFGWHKSGGFLIAEPEKALADCLYLSALRKRQFSHFPELDFPRGFSFDKVRAWLNRVNSRGARLHALSRLSFIEASPR